MFMHRDSPLFLLWVFDVVPIKRGMGLVPILDDVGGPLKRK